MTVSLSSLSNQADWLVIDEAILRVGQFPELDALLHQALDNWLQNLSSDIRWKIVLDTNPRSTAGSPNS